MPRGDILEVIVGGHGACLADAHAGVSVVCTRPLDGYYESVVPSGFVGLAIGQSML